MEAVHHLGKLGLVMVDEVEQALERSGIGFV